MMSTTITLDKADYNRMVFTLLEEVPTDQQVDWLQKFGSVFYDNEMYDSVDDKHSLSDEFFRAGAERFWGEDTILYKNYTWEALSTSLGTMLYELYLGFSFTAEKTISDIEYTLEAYNKKNGKRYYSPSLLQCLAAKYELKSTDVFSFTKILLPDFTMTIAFTISTKDGDWFYDLSKNPI
jgi:hypothetical protein